MGIRFEDTIAAAYGGRYTVSVINPDGTVEATYLLEPKIGMGALSDLDRNKIEFWTDPAYRILPMPPRVKRGRDGPPADANVGVLFVPTTESILRRHKSFNDGRNWK